MQVFLAVSVVVASTALSAQVFASGNHHSAPMGGRSALMGGTGVALGVDGAAPFLNPATLIRIEAGSLAFASRFYRFSRVGVSDFYTPAPIDGPSFGQTDEVNHSLHSIPDSVCYFFPPIGASRKQRLSLCLTTLEEQEVSLTALGLSRSVNSSRLDQNQHFDIAWRRFNVGPTWAIAIGEQLTLGASLMVSFSRYKQAISGSSVIESEASPAITSSYESLVSASSWDVATRLGATYRLSKRFALGASVTLPLFHVLGSLRETHIADSTDEHMQWQGRGDFRATPPLEFRVGLGGEWQSLRFEADVFLTPGNSSYVHGDLDREEVTVQSGSAVLRSASHLTVNERTDATLNLALGAEAFVAERLSILFGAQTDVNALKELRPEVGEARLFRTKLDYYRAGAGICSYTDYGDLMLGLRFDYGVGEAMPADTLVAPSGLGRSSMRDFGAMAVLAGSVSWRSIKQAVGNLGDVVNGDGGAPPKTAPAPLSAPKRKD
jgi:hypothetical protein